MVVKAPSVPPCLRGHLTAFFMSSQHRASFPVQRFILSLPPPPPIHTPFHTWKRMMRRVAGRCRFVPVCWNKWTKKRNKRKKGIREDFCDLWFLIIWSDSVYAEVMAAVILGIATATRQNLRHISRICHFLQAHKRESELLALITCFPMPFVAAEFRRLSPRLTKKKWITSILFDLFKGPFLIRSMVIWDSVSKMALPHQLWLKESEGQPLLLSLVLLNIHSSQWHVILYKNLECFQTE